MSFPVSGFAKSRLIRAGRVILGLAVGASFGIAVGALVASWVWGVAAIEGEAVRASYLAGAITIVGALVGAGVGYRAGRSEDDETVTNSEQAARRS